MTGSRPSPKLPKKIIVIGAGSIGRRHAGNLAHLGAEVSMYDVNQNLLKTTCTDNHWNPVFDLESAFEHKQFDAAIICTPTHLHIPIAQKVVDAGFDIFIEKPLSHTHDGVDELIKEIKNNHIIAMAGFNLRFEPGIAYLKKIIDPKNVAFVQIESGSHMPTWRPGVDYRTVYSANKSMGGGIILDDVHELDYACWLFGYPDSVICSYGKFSNFEIDVEDTAEFQLKYPDKLIAIHSDYLQKRYTRRCKICFRDGNTIEWVFGDRVVEYHNGNEKVFSYKDNFEVNNLYLQEMQMFLYHIEERSLPESDILNASKILKIALQAKQT
jgi:predicted dehydrogenase